MDEHAEQINHEVIQRLSHMRLERGLTHQQLADLTGLNRSYISLLEKGKRRPTLEVTLRLSIALGYPLSGLLSEVEAKYGVSEQPKSTPPDEGATKPTLLIGASIRKLRRKRGVSLEDLAKLTKLNPTTLSRIERDKISPTLDDLYAISAGLGISLNNLIATIQYFSQV